MRVLSIKSAKERRRKKNALVNTPRNMHKVNLVSKSFSFLSHVWQWLNVSKCRPCLRFICEFAVQTMSSTQEKKQLITQNIHINSIQCFHVYRCWGSICRILAKANAKYYLKFSDWIFEWKPRNGKEERRFHQFDVNSFMIA